MQPQNQPTLPSITAAQAFLAGAPGAWGKVASSVLLRSAIIAPALYVSGMRGKKRIAWTTAVVAIAIEAVVLVEVARQVKQPALPMGPA
jgi:hypothetical protein